MCFVHNTTRRLFLSLLIFFEIVLAVVLAVSLFYNERFERDYGAFAIDTERDYRVDACNNVFYPHGYQDLGYDSQDSCLKDQRNLVWTEYAAGVLLRIVM